MAQVSNRLNIRELSIEERILLAQDIWDSIVAEEESLTLTELRGRSWTAGWRHMTWLSKEESRGKPSSSE